MILLEDVQTELREINQATQKGTPVPGQSKWVQYGQAGTYCRGPAGHQTSHGNITPDLCWPYG